MSTLTGKKVTLHDMCLRDGMHPKRHRISTEQLIAIAKGLESAADGELRIASALNRHLPDPHKDAAGTVETDEAVAS